MAFQYQHYAVAFFDAERFKVVGALVARLFHILKCKAALGLIL